MRKVDTKKIYDIQQAVYSLVAEEGLINLSMSKISKRANVSPATIYIYYADKKELLSQIYISVKDLLDDGLDQALQEANNLPDKFKIGLLHFSKCFQQYPKQMTFMWALLNNSQELTEKAKNYEIQRSAWILNLIDEAIEKKMLTSDDPLIMQALTYGTLTSYLQNGGHDVEQIVDLIVKKIFNA